MRQRLKKSQQGGKLAPSDPSRASRREITAAICATLSDAAALYLKTKNYDRYMMGAPFREYRSLLEGQADHLYAMTDVILERARKIGFPMSRSTSLNSCTQCAIDFDIAYVEPLDLLADLYEDNQMLIACLREAGKVCDRHGDIVTASLIDVWIDETERRSWLLNEAGRSAE